MNKGLEQGGYPVFENLNGKFALWNIEGRGGRLLRYPEYFELKSGDSNTMTFEKFFRSQKILKNPFFKQNQ